MLIKLKPILPDIIGLEVSEIWWRQRGDVIIDNECSVSGAKECGDEMGLHPAYLVADCVGMLSNCI